jgi:NAD(P)-dependent dehydrogenase (short-subunit alcohol dehydrogenase family)
MTSTQNHAADPARAMAGKTIVMTGATSGLGAVAAGELAGRGGRIVLVARDRTRGDATLAELRRRNPAVDHRLHLADLSRLGEMKRAAAEIAAAEPRIDVLVNNAGALFGSEGVTPDGLERTFATNHMAYLVLTLGLREALAAAPGARVVSTASAAHRGSRFDPADIQSTKAFNGLRAYGRSKLYNILFTRELARRWAPLGITANCLHPGFVATRFGDGSGGWLAPLVGLAKRFAISPERGAQTLVYLASSPEVAGTTGAYFAQCRPVQPKPAARDDRAAAELWAESLALAGLAG